MVCFLTFETCLKWICWKLLLIQIAFWQLECLEMACVHKWQNHKGKYCYPKIIYVIFIIQCAYLSLAWSHIMKCYTNRRIRKTVPRFLGSDIWVWRRGRVLHFLCGISGGLCWDVVVTHQHSVLHCGVHLVHQMVILGRSREEREERNCSWVYCDNTYEGIWFCTVKNSNATEGKPANGQKNMVSV